MLDRRILAIAEALGIGENWLRQAYADQNKVALDGQKDDFDRLALLSGADFDRRFWVTVARDQSAASGLLAAVAGTVPRLDPLISETVRLLDRSIRRATAAQALPNASPRR